MKKLKGQLEEKQKNGKLENAQSEVEVLENGTDMHMIDLQSKLCFHFKRTFCVLNEGERTCLYNECVS
mgnify:FL=1